jgi:serine/threonine protein kinase/tetratricopeptide (TPR) repeat protein
VERKCPRCGSENTDTARFCSNCAAPLSHEGGALHTKTLETPTEDLATGSTFAGRYQIIEDLGEGGMGKVYKVLDKETNEKVALKLIKPEIASDKKTIERFRNELTIARKISQKYVCRMYDLGREGSSYFITMEYVPGEDLKGFIRRSGQLAVGTAIRIAKQVCEGLTEAHRLGVVHRDLKPGNIMIDKEGNARIMDFGIARSSKRKNITGSGVMIGTPEYMSPEQVEGKEVDQRSDIYSIGVILFEMTTGRLPFEGETALSTALKHKTEVPPSPSDFNRQMSSDLSQLVLRCLEKDPEKRFQTAEELLSDLAGLERESSLTEPQAVPSRSSKAINSIAVLPFKDMSPQRDQEYFCDGLAEELISALTRVKGLKVAARTSSFSFKEKDEDIREIGKRLNVGSVLEGSVQKSGNHLRITAQLIGVSDGYHLWSERFDRKFEDVFAIQDEISMAVVDKLKVELLEGEREKLTKRHTEDKEAYQLYLKGRYHWNRRYPKDMVMAVDYFQRAIDIDPSYALPLGGIADVFNMLAEFGFIPPQEAYLKSKALLQKALEIDDSISEIYSSLALITYCYEWDLPAAERYAIRSIELNPQNMFGYATYGEILGSWGRNKEALEQARRAVESDPLFSLAHAFYAIILSVTGSVEEGRERMLRAYAMEPDQPMIYFFLGLLYLAKPALPEKAIEYLQKAADLGVTLSYGYLGMARAILGQKDEALKYLAKIEKVEKERFLALPLKLLLYMKPGLRHFRSFKKKYCPAYLKALIYLGLNMQEEAFVQLEKSIQARDYLVPALLKLIEIYDLPRTEEIVSSPILKAIKAKIKTS